MDLMQTYNEKLTEDERQVVEIALDALKDACADELSLKLANDDRAARAAEALARYIVESRT